MHFSDEDPEYQRMVKQLERNLRYERYKDAVLKGTCLVIIVSIIGSGMIVTVMSFVRAATRIW
jgi:hypothetical protein